MFKKLINFAFMFALGCNPAPLDVKESDTTIEQPSPITWEDCSYTVTDHPCDFSLENEKGETVTLYQYYGKPIILDLSAMWCSYCQVAAGESESLLDNHNDNNLIWITVLFDDLSGGPVEQSDLQLWVDNFELKDSITLSGDRSDIDPSGLNGFPVQSWPTFIFINQEMIVSDIMKGWSSEGVEYYVTSMLQDFN